MSAIDRLGIIGAGQMGNGIAHVAALAGLAVVMIDVQAEALSRALTTMAKNMDRQVQKGGLSAADRDAALGRVTTATENAALAECDMVVEAATEREEVKLAILRGLVPSQAGGDHRLQHLLHPDHPCRRGHRSAGEGHWHAFHESGAGHEAGRGDPGHRHG